jgi:hypothetical protein
MSLSAAKYSHQQGYTHAHFRSSSGPAIIGQPRGDDGGAACGISGSAFTVAACLNPGGGAIDDIPPAVQGGPGTTPMLCLPSLAQVPMSFKLP